MATERCAATLLAGVLLVACGGGEGGPGAVGPADGPSSPPVRTEPTRPVAPTPGEPAEMSEAGYFTIGELTTSDGRPVEFLAILAEDAAAFGMADPGDDLCVGVGSPAEGSFGGGCMPRPTTTGEGFGASEEGSDLCVHHVTVPGGSAAVEAAGVRVPLERLPGSDRLGVDVLAACFEAPPGGIDDVALVTDDGTG